MSNLNLQQERFVQEYIIDFNATQAAKRAGYSAKTAYSIGHELLKKPEIKKAVKDALDDFAERAFALKKRVVNELAAIAFSDITDFYERIDGDSAELTDVKALDRSTRSLIKEIKQKKKYGQIEETEITLKLWSKEKALELLSRHLGVVSEPVVAIADQRQPKAKRTFTEFCLEAGYPQPFPKQIEMKDFVVHGGTERLEEPRLLLGTRGIGKTEMSTICGLAYAIYLDPDDTTILSTWVDKNGSTMVKAIARALEANGVQLTVNNSEAVRVAGCTRKENNINMVPIRSGGFRSNHPRRVVFDDPVVPGHVSEADRKKVLTAYEEAIKLTKNIAIIGQPVDFRDLYSKLRGIIRTMEVPHGTIPELDHDLDVQRAAGVDEKSIQASYFLKVTPEGDASFHDINLIDNFPAKNKNAIMFIDPADGGDYTAVGAFTNYFDGLAIVGRTFKKSWHLCLDEIYDMCVKYGVIKVGFETNKFGVLPLQVLREKLAALNVSVEGKYTHSNKQVRIQLASQYSKSLYLSKESDVEYRRQVVEYSHDAKFDDSPDTIATFLEWAGKIRPPKAIKEPSNDL
jgi:phage terminase small subunit